MKWTRLVALLAALIVLVIAAPAQADEPGEVSQEEIWVMFPDSSNGVAVFWNITRDGYCAWEASGFEGPPPLIELVPAKGVFLMSGRLIGSWNATRPVELWTLDDDVPPLIGPCQDTDDQAGPWATGTMTAEGRDNDVFGSTLRTNTFGDRGYGTVYDGAGTAYDYSWTFQARVMRGEFMVLIDETNLSIQ